MFAALFRRLRAAHRWIRFGELKATIKAVDGGTPSEIAYMDRWGRLVGYQAYGHFDPAMPYRGE